MYTVDIINVYNLPDVAQGKKDKDRFILKCSNLQKLTPECIHFFFLLATVCLAVSLLTRLCPVPVGSKSNLCHGGIGAEPHPQAVAVGHQDWRPCGAAEFTNQGRRLIAAIPGT